MNDQSDKPTPRNRIDLYDAFGLFTRGLAMGAADVIPGASGGTIAFISGIYERFIKALRSLSPAFVLVALRGRISDARGQFLAIDWATLIPLGAGIAIAILTMSKLIIGLMDDHQGPMYAFFFGLILASAWIPLAFMRRFGWRHAMAIAVAAAGAWAFVGLRAGPIDLIVTRADAGATTILYPTKLRSETDATAVQASAERAATAHSAEAPLTIVVFDPKPVLADTDQLGDMRLIRLATREEAAHFLADPPALIVLEEKRASLLWILVCGAVAISAMILPGLSGSFLLLFLGQYQAVYSTIHQCIGHVLLLLGRTPDPLVAVTAHEWTSDFLFVGAFGIGVLIGLAVFSRVVALLFVRAHDLTMAALTGIMLGALRQPGELVWNESRAPGSGSGYWTLVVGVAIAGGAIVLGLHFADRWFRSRRAVEAK